MSNGANAFLTMFFLKGLLNCTKVYAVIFEGKKSIIYEKQLLQSTRNTIFQALVSELKTFEQRFSVESHFVTNSRL